MIRRKAGDDWLIISQLEHARLAEELARMAWGRLPHRIALCKAIRHHDDGWWEWEQKPTVDPKTGTPRDFDEMPMSTATQIWTECVNICANPARKEGSLLGGYWVSSHFTYLAEMALDSRKKDPDEGEEGDIPALQEFLDTQRPLQQNWFSQASEQYPESEGEESSIELSVSWLQGYDWFSLWLCCDEQTEPTTVPFPSGHSFQLTPRSETEIEYPASSHALHYSKIRLEVPAIRIPQRRYTDQELTDAIRTGTEETVSWTLIRQPA